MKIEIILRTHDKTNIHNTSRTDMEIEPRYCHKDKRTLALGCVTSLINSANAVINHDINFKILDDHSTDEFIVELKKIFNKSKWPYQIVHLGDDHNLRYSFNYSALKQFEACRDSKADLVYSVEDDFLHDQSCLQEMIDTWDLFTKLSGRDIILYPYDIPDDYRPPRTSIIAHGSNRHWKTGLLTTNTLFLSPHIVKNNWNLFEILATKYNPDYSAGQENVDEASTIAKIWIERGAMRFSPIPSLALHMQFEPQKDPYIDWQKWWEDYAIID